MKYVWEPEDIIPGRFVCKSKNKRGMRVYLLGYRPALKKEKYCMISIDTDGLVYKCYTRKGMASLLNEWEAVPTTILVPRNDTHDVEGYEKFKDIQKICNELKRIEI